MFYMPQEEIESLARWFLPQIEEFYNSEEGQKLYEKWMQEEAEEANTESEDNE